MRSSCDLLDGKLRRSDSLHGHEFHKICPRPKTLSAYWSQRYMLSLALSQASSHQPWLNRVRRKQKMQWTHPHIHKMHISYFTLLISEHGTVSLNSSLKSIKSAIVDRPFNLGSGMFLCTFEGNVLHATQSLICCSHKTLPGTLQTSPGILPAFCAKHAPLAGPCKSRWPRSPSWGHCLERAWLTRLTGSKVFTGPPNVPKQSQPVNEFPSLLQQNCLLQTDICTYKIIADLIAICL